MAKKGHFWAILGPFWHHFGPPNGLGSPKSEWGTGQNGPKAGQRAIKMCFETVLDHLEAISIPSISISKGIKNKKNRPIVGPQVPLALIGWQRAPLIGPPQSRRPTPQNSPKMAFFGHFWVIF